MKLAGEIQRLVLACWSTLPMRKRNDNATRPCVFFFFPVLISNAINERFWGMIFSYAKVNNNPHITKFQPHLFLHIWGYFMVFVENRKSKRNTPNTWYYIVLQLFIVILSYLWITSYNIIKYQIEISQKYWKLLLSDKTFLSRAGKIRAGTYCRSRPFLVTLLLLRNKQPWAKVIILADSRSIVR